MTERYTLTKHNGRAGKNGVYNPKHNDRSFDINASEHIDTERIKQNIYWDFYNGYSNWEGITRDHDTIEWRFEDVEQQFYGYRYRDYCNAQHERNRISGHSSRDREPDDLRLSNKTCPEESLIQIGSMESHVDRLTLLEIAADYFDEHQRRFGEHVHILDWGLHCDESTPHIHERHVFDCVNRYGEIQPHQKNALEALGIPLPYPDQKESKTNNRKVMFDSICRTMLMDIAKAHGLIMQEEPSYGGRSYLEKQDYIMMHQKEVIRKQQEQIADKTAELSSITVRINDTEQFVQEIADEAYNKAVSVVTEQTVIETRKADAAMITDYWNNQGRNDPELNRKTGALVAKHLNKIIEKLKGISAAVTKKVMDIMQDPVISQKNKEPIKRSILERLDEKKQDVYQRESERMQADQYNRSRFDFDR